MICSALYRDCRLQRDCSCWGGNWGPCGVSLSFRGTERRAQSAERGHRAKFILKICGNW